MRRAHGTAASPDTGPGSPGVALVRPRGVIPGDGPGPGGFGTTIVAMAKACFHRRIPAPSFAGGSRMGA